MRRFLYSAYLLWAYVLAFALVFPLLHLALVHVEPSSLPQISWTTIGHAAQISLILILGGLLLGLLVIAASSRLSGSLIRPDKVYVLYGLHYLVYRYVLRSTNSLLYNVLFGDSSYIVQYLRLIGYRLSNYVQTGSNFGTRQDHDIPTLCRIGRGTMASGGLSMVNAKLGSSSFKVSEVIIGEASFLGNEIHYPAGAKAGRNCLFASKVMVPLHGEIKEDVGLLGSPCIEIPRSSLRDQNLSSIDDEVRRARLSRKNRVNLCSMGLLLLFNWGIVVALIVIGHAIALLHAAWGDWLLALTLPAVSLVVISCLILGERLSCGFKRMSPKICSMYDPYFWGVERYWKFTESILLVVFKGTPLRNIISRMAGVDLGKRVFDDGCVVTEKTLVSIGDDCTLNETALIQAHSLEEGVYKSDRIVIASGATIGAQCFIHYAVDIGENSSIEPDSFVMKGEVIAAGTTWRGNPAQPI